MSGIARTSAAITITNALPTGVGCAVGIALHCEAQVTLSIDPSLRTATLEIPADVRSSVVEESLRSGLEHYYPQPGATARLSLRSEIPLAKGLKSSSAVSTSILLAVARAADRNPTAMEIGLHSAEVGRRAGVSATGALDDALAGLDPGFVITENSRGDVLRRSPVDSDWGVALYVPTQSHPPSPNLIATFSAERPAGERAVRAALTGDWAAAMRLNSELVERSMGYSYGEIRERLRMNGAIASGVSGLGPTLAAIAPRDRLTDVVRAFPSDAAAKFTVAFTRTSAMEGAGP
ncbi:MAG: shikimate kinase [Thermoplasmata archaeon]